MAICKKTTFMLNHRLWQVSQTLELQSTMLIITIPLASSVLPCNPCGILCNMPPYSQDLTIHFIRFYTCFSSQGGCSDSSHRRTQNTYSHSNLRSFCWLHTKIGPSKVEGVNLPSGPWPTSGCLSMGVAGRTCLPTSMGIL